MELNPYELDIQSVFNLTEWNEYQILTKPDEEAQYLHILKSGILQAK